MSKLIEFTDKHSGKEFAMVANNPTTDHILQNGIFEYPLIEWCKQFLDSEGIFLDIGAHMGTYSVLLANHCKKIYAFECQASTFECLQKSISLNGLGYKIKPINVALGNQEQDGDVMDLNKVSEDGGGSTLSLEAAKHGPADLGTEQVMVRSLDSFNLTNISFLKLDVEGWELDVLKGSEKTLELSGYPKFIFEVWPDAWYSDQRQRLFEYVQGLGYKIIPIGGVSNMFLAEYS